MIQNGPKQPPGLAAETEQFLEMERAAVAELAKVEAVFASIAGQESPLTDPESIRLQIFDAHSKNDRAKISAFISEHKISSSAISTHQYKQTVKEVLQLRHHFLKMFPGVDFSTKDAEKQLRSVIVNRVMVKESRISVAQLLDIFTANPLIRDLTFFISQLLVHSSPAVLLAESRWIGDPEAKKMCQHVGPELHWLMSQSRNLGLIDFEALRKLRTLKIRVLGASVAASTIDLLVALGAENIEFIDGGRLDIAKLPAMPQGSIASIDELKAVQVMRAAHSRNPYGNFRGHPGFVRMKVAEVEGSDDRFYDEFVKGADLLIEVVDQAALKVWTRVRGENSATHPPVLLLADLGNKPVAGLEDPHQGNYFNQNLSTENKNQLRSFLDSENPTPLEKARAIYLMVKNDVPAEHLLQFLVASSGSMPFWSQTPIASRESAAVAAKIILAHLSDKNVMGKNYSAGDVPSILVNELTAEQQELLSQTVAEFLHL